MEGNKRNGDGRGLFQHQDESNSVTDKQQQQQQ